MKKDLDWSSLGFGYIATDYRYSSKFKDGAWDEGALIEDSMITMTECAGVLQYSQSVFEGLKAYTTADGRTVRSGQTKGANYGQYHRFCGAL